MTRCLKGFARRSTKQVLTGANQTGAYAKLVVAREIEKRLVRAQRDRHEHLHGRHGHEVFERHNEENVVGSDASVPWGRALGW